MLFGVPLSFDPFACILGVIAVWLAWAAFRSSTYHIVRVENFEANWVQDVNPSECGPSFEVTILNCGLPIHSLKVSLFYITDEEQPTRFSIALKQLNAIEGNAFDKGMRGVFMVRPLHFPNNDWFEAKIKTLTDPLRQKAAIIVKSGDFTVQTIPFASKMSPLIQRWNNLATDVNSRLSKRFNSKNGTHVVEGSHFLPVFGLEATWKLLTFVRFCNNMKEQKQQIQSMNSARHIPRQS